MQMEGVLLVDKPKGWTSHDVVAKVRNLIKETTGQRIKVGHTGTLDPMATGLMILVIGSYTKRAGEFSKLDKTYVAELTLGAISTTADAEGEITQVSKRIPSGEEVEKTLVKFHGEIEQTPPAFSAIKVEGKRAYKLARKGEAVKLESRKITIYHLRTINYDYPKLIIIARVSSGTYIRSLATEIGEKLGSGAYLSSLRRLQVGEFDVVKAEKPDCVDIEPLRLSKHL